MICPVCGGAELVHEARDLPYAYQGASMTLCHVAGEYCSACGEGVLDWEESLRTSALMLAFNRQVHSAQRVDKGIKQGAIQ